MFRVQYARQHHARIGFKGLKDDSFDDIKEKVENENDRTNTLLV